MACCAGGVGLVATHRRPVVAEPPAPLRSFDPDDWQSSDRSEAFREWELARLEWVKSNPHTLLGNALDVLREHRRLRMAYRDGS